MKLTICDDCPCLHHDPEDGIYECGNKYNVEEINSQEFGYIRLSNNCKMVCMVIEDKTAFIPRGIDSDDIKIVVREFVEPTEMQKRKYELFKRLNRAMYGLDRNAIRFGIPDWMYNNK